MTHLPYFLPEDYTGLPEVSSAMFDRPYFAVAGRLEKIKGFQDVIEAMGRLPHLDLRIAGSGPFEADLRHFASARIGDYSGERALDSARPYAETRSVTLAGLILEGGA